MSALTNNHFKTSGRTSSQRSIFEYPEHLNPFYEAENHKRLRFWNISNEKNNGGKKRASRSNSFSFDGLKELWSLKSFRLKKRSSTLGINKTSESPPMLRRDDDVYNCDGASKGVQIRHTIDMGLSNNFQRGAPYRSSLQDLNSKGQQVFFVRNHRYRNTVQNGNLRASTSALQTGHNRYSISRGSSQLSVNSTNPFEDDYVGTLGPAGSIDGSVGGLSMTRGGRKKRRAPQPPKSPPKTTVDESVDNSLELSADPADGVKPNEFENLTAEIESFVRTVGSTIGKEENTNQVSNEEEKMNILRLKHTENVNEMRQSPESNDFYDEVAIVCNHQSDQLTFDKIQNLGAACDFDQLSNYETGKRSPVKILIREPTEEDYEETDTNINLCDKVYEIKEVDLVENKNMQNIENELAKFECNTPTSLEVENILENQNRDSINSATNSLRITESCDNLFHQSSEEPTANFEVCKTSPDISPDDTYILETSTIDSSQGPQSDAEREKTASSIRFEVRAVPLKICSPGPYPNDSKITNDSSAEQVPPTPPRRVRTVKEIIESINKSQSLLKINQNINKVGDEIHHAEKSFTPQDDNIAAANGHLNAKDLEERKKPIVADENGNSNVIGGTSGDIPLSVARYNEVSRNNSTSFKRCMVDRYGNSNDGDEKSKDVEWNPVPKPRRHKHSP